MLWKAFAESLPSGRSSVPFSQTLSQDDVVCLGGADGDGAAAFSGSPRKKTRVTGSSHSQLQPRSALATRAEVRSLHWPFPSAYLKNTEFLLRAESSELTSFIRVLGRVELCRAEGGHDANFGRGNAERWNIEPAEGGGSVCEG